MGSGMIPRVLPGFLGGYPVGAQITGEGWRRGQITEPAANRLLMFCSQAGPSFFFGIVASRFPGIQYAWALWGIQLTSALSVAVLTFQSEEGKARESKSHPVSLTDAMHRSLYAMVSVCGWVVIFRVILGFCDRIPIGNTERVLLSGLLEITNGCMKLDTITSIPARFLMAAVMLNFGGLCVMLQTASVIKGLSMRFYILGKLLQTCFCVLYSLLFLGYRWAAVPILSVFLLQLQRNPVKNSSIPVRIGV
jgi:hypothetical protein